MVFRLIKRMSVSRPYQGSQTFRLHLLVLRSFQLAIIPNPLKGMGIPARIVKIGIGALARRYSDNYFTASIGLGNQWVVWDDRLILGLRFLEDTVTLNATGKMLNFFTIIGIELGRNLKD